MEHYTRYRWFYTSRGTLVVGGKNALQNDSLLREITGKKQNFVIMHTAHPGSPFSVIMAERSNVRERDIEECAIFTGGFSRAWKMGAKTTLVDIFISDQISKEPDMKAGTWKVAGKVRRKTIELKFALVKQKGVLRAVPLMSALKKEYFMVICPGTIDKTQMAARWEVMLGNEVSHDELIAALPAGGVRECR